jgi:hypothetical protein
VWAVFTHCEVHAPNDAYCVENAVRLAVRSDAHARAAFALSVFVIPVLAEAPADAASAPTTARMVASLNMVEFLLTSRFDLGVPGARCEDARVA